MRTVEEIARIYSARLQAQRAEIDLMTLFRQYLNGELEVNVAELDSNERSAIANLANQGLEQFSLRVASTLPQPESPSVRPGFKEHDDRARTRKKAILGWWDHNQMEEVLTLRAMDLLAYGSCPVSVLPDPETKIPIWQKHDPLTVFAAPCANPVDMVPRDAIVTTESTFGWLEDVYGTVVRKMYDGRRDAHPDDPILTLRSVDSTEIVLLATTNPRARTFRGSGVHAPTQEKPTFGGNDWVELERMPNKAGCPLVFNPGWQTPVGRRGRFNGTIGAHQMRAKLLAIAYITAVRGAMPEEWLEPIDANGPEPEVKKYPDPRTGEPGETVNGKINVVRTDPGFMTSPMMSILEREARLDAGIMAEFGGESASSVRTGRRGDSILSATVDFPIQRAQRLLARSLSFESRAAVHIVKRWTPGAKSFYVSWKGATGYVDYDPVEVFDSDQVNVAYSMAGSDLNNDILRAQSKVGTGLWSRQTGREMDPETPDAEMEHDRIVAEQIEDVALAMFTQQVQDGTLNVDDLHAFYESIRKDKREVVDALKHAHDKAKDRQEQAAQAETQEQPGLAAPPPVPEAAEGLENLSRTKFLLGSVLGGGGRAA